MAGERDKYGERDTTTRRDISAGEKEHRDTKAAYISQGKDTVSGLRDASY